MQKPNIDLNEVALVPIPWELLDEIDLDPTLDAMQLSVRRGRLIIEPIDADEHKICIGRCRGCLAIGCEARSR